MSERGNGAHFNQEIENIEKEFQRLEMPQHQNQHHLSKARGPLPPVPGEVRRQAQAQAQGTNHNNSSNMSDMSGRRTSESTALQSHDSYSSAAPMVKYTESIAARSAISAARQQYPAHLNRPGTPTSHHQLQHAPQHHQYNQYHYRGGYPQHYNSQHQQYYVAPQQIYYHASPSGSYQQQQRVSATDNTDTVSVHSAATAATSAVIPHKNLEAYRQETKKSKDPVQQFKFAKELVLVAEEMRKNPQGLDPQKIRKNRDILHNEALKWIKKAAAATYNGKTGYAEALFYLADCYGNGNLGLTIDHERAFGYYTQGAKQDHSASVYRTGVCYEVGAGPKRDHQRAVQYYKKAAALGDPAAMFKIGMILLEGTLGQSRNPKEGINLLKRAATQADETTPYALHELAILYEGTNLDPSTGIVPDPVYSFELFLKASQLGYAPSQYKLGLAHEYGHLGLVIDAKRSIAWYTKAAQQGEAEAELALSGWYLTGYEGILNQSDKEAFLWSRKAASKGLAKAEYAVGYFMEHGVGIEQNLEEARRWYIRAAGQGNPRAIARLNDKGPSKKEHQIRPSDWKRSKDAQNCSVM